MEMDFMYSLNTVEQLSTHISDPAFSWYFRKYCYNKIAEKLLCIRKS